MAIIISLTAPGHVEQRTAPGAPCLRPHAVLTRIGKLTGLTREQIGRTGGRQPGRVDVRYAAIYWLHHRTSCTHVEIARLLAYDDHTTITYALKKVQERMAVYPEFAQLIASLDPRPKTTNDDCLRPESKPVAPSPVRSALR